MSKPGKRFTAAKATFNRDKLYTLEEAVKLVKDAAKAKQVLIVPGAAFSGRDTHFRISYAIDEKTLEEGIDVLVDLMK